MDVEEALLWGSLPAGGFVTPETLYDLCSGDGRVLDALLARTVDVGTMYDFLNAADSVVRVGQALDWLESVNASGLEIAADRYESLLRAARSVLGAGLPLDGLEGPLHDGVDLDVLARLLDSGDVTVEQARAALDAGVSLEAFGELLDNGWSVEEALFLAPSAAVVMPDSAEEYYEWEWRIDGIREERIDYSYDPSDDMWHPFARHLWEGVPLEEVAARIAAGDEPESPRDRELRERSIQEFRDAGVSDEHARQLEEAGISAGCASLSELLAAVDAGVDLQAVVSFVSQGGTFAQYWDNSMLVVAELSAAGLLAAELTVSSGPRRVIPVGARPAAGQHVKGCGCVTCR